MNNLKKLRKEKGIGQVEISKALDIGQSSYSRYESGNSDIPTDVLKKLSDYFGVSIDTILGREESEPFGRPIVMEPVPKYEDEVMLPVVASLRCGYGMTGDPFTVVSEYPVPKSWLKQYGKGCVLTYAVGTSMSPTIKPGDLMLCYPSDWWDDGMVVIINVDDSDTVKRIYHSKDGGVDLVPDNPTFKSVHYSPEDIQTMNISVLGHVIRVIPPEIKPIKRREKNENRP